MKLRGQLLLISTASVLLAVAAIGLGWLPPLFNTEVNPVLDYLRNTQSGDFVSRLSLVLGAGLLLQHWLSLGRILLGPTPLAARQLLPFFLIPASFLFFTPPLFSRDVYSYMAQARLYLRGFSPYEYGVGWLPGWFQLGADPLWVDTPTPYGSLAIWLGANIEIVTNNSPYNALLWHRALAMLGVALGAFATNHLLRQQPRFAMTAIWLAWLNPLVILHFFSAAHNDALMLGLLICGFALAQQNRFVIALTLLILAAGIKPVALLAAPFILIGRSNRNILQMLRPWSLGAVFVLSGLWVQGLVTGLGLGWVTALGAPTQVRSLLSPVTAISEILTRPFEALGLIDADFVIGLFQFLAILLALTVVLFLALTPTVRSPLRSTAIAFTVVVLLSPVVQPWYLIWAFSFIALAGVKKAWHLKTIILLTAVFVAYSAIEANIVLDTAINLSDYLAGISAVMAVLLVIWVSKLERELLFGKQFDSGLVQDYFESRTDQAAER